MKYDIKTDNFGTKFYFKSGTDILHREDGPAVEHYNGDKSWFQNGLLHRLDGPAIEFVNGQKMYFIKNIKYAEEDYWYIVKNNLHILL